jgi:hypothetical protein
MSAPSTGYRITVDYFDERVVRSDGDNPDAVVLEMVKKHLDGMFQMEEGEDHEFTVRIECRRIRTKEESAS